MKVLLLAAIFYMFGTQYQTTFSIKSADYVERRIVGEGVIPEEFYFSFSSVYQINGERVSTTDFWRHADKGEQLQVKAQLRRGFWFVNRVNLKETD